MSVGGRSNFGNGGVWFCKWFSKKKRGLKISPLCTRSRGRTGTTLLSLVFETNASTDSAIRASTMNRECKYTQNSGTRKPQVHFSRKKAFPAPHEPIRSGLTAVLHSSGNGPERIRSCRERPSDETKEEPGRTEPKRSIASAEQEQEQEQEPIAQAQNEIRSEAPDSPRKCAAKKRHKILANKQQTIYSRTCGKSATKRQRTKQQTIRPKTRHKTPANIATVLRPEEAHSRYRRVWKKS